MSKNDLIAVYLVTHRRHEMLRRALRSVLVQSHTNLVVKVVNDDPNDDVVQDIVEAAGDPRVGIFLPMVKRGPTKNFNLLFQEKEASFVALLEDDNWWDPEFLSSMLSVLVDNPDSPVVVGNETIWKELPNDGWHNTQRTIWDFRGVRQHFYSLIGICGHAKICNSSMLFRLPQARAFCTPDTIPVDVTEHFRERLLPSPILLNGDPLVNYAETIGTARGIGSQWGQYQQILIGSVFIALDGSARRRRLARALWAECKSPFSPRAVTLVNTGLAIREASALVRQAPLKAIVRTSISKMRAPQNWGMIGNTQQRLARELDFLVKAPLTQALASDFE